MESSRTTARLHAVSACPLATPSLAIRLAPNDAAGVIRLLGLSRDDLRNPEFVAAPLNLPVPFYSRGGADGGRHGCGRGQRVPGASSNSTRTTVCVTSISVDRQSLQKMAREEWPCRTNKHFDLCSPCCRRVLFQYSSWGAPSLAFIDQSNSRYEGYGLRPFRLTTWICWSVTPIRSTTIACLAILASLPATAQPNGKPWSGVLRDDHRRPIAGASVRVESGGHQATVVTASDGSFSFAALAPAAYTVSVEYQGTTATFPQPVQLPRDASAVLELSAGGSLSVVDQAQTGQGSGGQTLSGKAVSDLPLNKRDFSALLLLAAGTMTDTNGSTNFTQQFAINGQRGTAAVFAMDGVDSERSRNGWRNFHEFQC